MLTAVLHLEQSLAGEDFLKLGRMNDDSPISAENDMAGSGQITPCYLIHHAVHVFVVPQRTEELPILENRQIGRHDGNFRRRLFNHSCPRKTIRGWTLRHCEIK